MGFDDSTEPGAHINPNIHRDGLVCLSLLNTWRGDTFERWQPNKSTLLSLFVSVQAMVLGVENPLLNFPGLDDDEKTSELIKYKNDYVQSLTVDYAMVWWITQDKAKNSVWGKISAMYWKHKGTQLMKSAERWVQTNKCLKDYCEGATVTFASAAGLEIPKGYIDMGLVLKSRL